MKKYQDEGEIIVDKERNAFIPKDEGNKDYRKYLEWLAEGNTPIPAQPTGDHYLDDNDEWVLDLDKQAQSELNQAQADLDAVWTNTLLVEVIQFLIDKGTMKIDDLTPETRTLWSTLAALDADVKDKKDKLK